MKKLNISKLRKNKKTKIISLKESLKDVEPINWSEEVVNGDKKVNITINEDK